MKNWLVRFYSGKCALAFLCAFLSFLSAAEIRGAAGDLDPSFGVQGRQFITVSNTEPVFGIKNRATDIVVQPDGKTLVSGYAWDPSMGDSFIIMRFNQNGGLDSGFANGGIFRYEYGPVTDQLYGIALQPDGKIVAAGQVYLGVVNGGGDTAFAVIRLNPNGTFDPSFGAGGIVVTNFFTSIDQATEVLIQPDGKIIASGWVTQGGNNNGLAYDFALVRYNPNGSLDTSFGSGGIVFTDFNGRGDLAQSSVLQPDGKIVLAGWVSVLNSDYDFGLARYNPDGSLDTTFDGDGKVVTPIRDNLGELARAVTLAPDGKLVVAGDLYNPPVAGSGSGHRDLVAVRYNPNGTLDTGFDGDGKFIYDSNQGDHNDDGEDVVVQPDGKILIAGQSHLIQEPGVSHTDMLIIRLRTNGTIDNTFGSGGIRLVDFGMFHPTPGSTRTGDSGTAIALQPDGKIVVPGEAYWGNGDNSFAIARLLNDITTNVVRRTQFDFDGDGRADIGVFRQGNWYLQNSSTGFTATQFGIASDKITPADYDGDGKTDLGVFRDGTWYLQRSTAGFTGVQFGSAGDIPQTGDFDGDGKTDLAVFRPGDGTWYLQRSRDGFTGVQFGQNGDKPVAADYDGDGKTDLAVYRGGTWYVLQSRDGFKAAQFGIASDKITPADYDGDGKADFAVFRDGTWYLQRSQAGFAGVQFGVSSDVPTPADYDGDGKTDIAVYRDGTWYLQQSTSGFTAVQFGQTGDVPVSSANLP